jgi:hypothetical protein
MISDEEDQDLLIQAALEEDEEHEQEENVKNGEDFKLGCKECT